MGRDAARALMRRRAAIRTVSRRGDDAVFGSAQAGPPRVLASSNMAQVWEANPHAKLKTGNWKLETGRTRQTGISKLGKLGELGELGYRRASRCRGDGVVVVRLAYPPAS